MLVLRRKEGQWIKITHEASGETLWIKAAEVCPERKRIHLLFDDQARNFDVQRPERKPQSDLPKLDATLTAPPDSADKFREKVSKALRRTGEGTTEQESPP
jgi:hypothetical protein